MEQAKADLYVQILEVLRMCCEAVLANAKRMQVVNEPNVALLRAMTPLLHRELVSEALAAFPSLMYFDSEDHVLCNRLISAELHATSA